MNRERFEAACAAMQGMLSCREFMNEMIVKVVGSKTEARSLLAEWSVKQADALLAALAEPEKDLD
jgi:hypothetical protein